MVEFSRITTKNLVPPAPALNPEPAQVAPGAGFRLRRWAPGLLTFFLLASVELKHPEVGPSRWLSARLPGISLLLLAVDQLAAPAQAQVNAQSTAPGKPEVIPFQVPGSGNCRMYFLAKWTAVDNATHYTIQYGNNFRDGPYTGTEGRVRKNSSNFCPNATFNIKVCASNASKVCSSSYSPVTSVQGTASVSASNVTKTGAKLTVSGLPAQWWYKGNQSGATCKAVANGTTSATLTGLTSGTSYRYDIYYRSNCQEDSGKESHWDVKATFTTLGLRASNVQATTATLTNTGHTGNWYYKANAAPHTACSSAVSGTTKDLTGLSGNTSYTYTAYSDSSCTAGNKLTTAPAFLTKPAKPSTPAVATNAGSGKLDLSSAVSGGSGDLSKWQVQQKASTDNNFGSWKDVSSVSTVLSHTVTGLTDGTTYQFKVRAKNATGDGAASDASTAIAPVERTLTASNVTHNAAKLAITGYIGNWYYKANATPHNTCSSAVSGTSEDLSGLSSNTSYTYKAYSDSTCTDANELVAADSFLTKPSKAATPTVATDVGSGKLTITSSVSDSGTLSKWQYQQKEGSSDFGSWTDISSTSTSLSHTVTGLTNGTNYQFKVHAVNATGNGAASDASTAKAPTEPTLGGSSVEVTTATLTIGNWSGAWYYKANAAPHNTCSSVVSAGTTTKALTGLSGNTSYTYKAYSDSTCTDANEIVTASAFPTKPGTPTTPTASATGSGKLRLAASVTGDGAITRWEVQQKKDDTAYSPWRIIASTATTLSHTVTGLTNGSSYTVQGARQERHRHQRCFGCLHRRDARGPVAEGKFGGSRYGHPHHRRAHRRLVLHAPPLPATGTCSTDAVSGTSVDLTSLSGNTSYTYTAYSDSSCTAANELAVTSAFLTKPGTPTTPTVTANVGSGKLTITSSVTGGGTLTKWQYQQKTDGSFGSWRNISSTSTSLTHTVGNLTDDTNYQFTVRAVNATGNGAASDASMATAPAATSLASGSVEAATATLTISNYGSAWYYKANATPHNTCQGPVDAGTTTSDLTGLSGNTSYTYKAYADSSCSTLVASTSAFLTKPGQPTKPSVVANAVGGKLTLSASVTGSGALSRWQYQQKVGNNNYGSWQNISSTSTSLSHTISGLTLLTTNYQFKVRAVNATGDGAASDASTAVTPSETTLTANTVEATTATLTIGNRSGSWYYKYTVPSGGTCSAEIAAGTTTADLSSLSDNTSYTFTAYSDSGCTASLATADAFLTKPGKPTGFTVEAGTNSDELDLTTSVSGSGTLLKWQYQQKEGNSGFGPWIDIASTTTSLSHTLTGLKAGVNYQFKVRAVNATGNGAASDASTAVALSGKMLTASQVETKTATLTIANYLTTEQWWYKANAVPDNTCSSAVSAGTTTKDLTGLSGNTSYTYTAYSDSSCTAANEIVTAPTFLTKPGQPTRPDATVGDEMGSVKLTASVTGDGAITKWQYVKKEGTNAFETIWKDIPSTSTRSLSHTVTGLTTGTEYEFKVRAVNDAGDGLASEPSAAVAPAQAGLKTVKPAGATTATLHACVSVRCSIRPGAGPSMRMVALSSVKLWVIRMDPEVLHPVTSPPARPPPARDAPSLR